MGMFITYSISQKNCPKTHVFGKTIYLGTKSNIYLKTFTNSYTVVYKDLYTVVDKDMVHDRRLSYIVRLSTIKFRGGEVEFPTIFMLKFTSLLSREIVTKCFTRQNVTQKL